MTKFTTTNFSIASQIPNFLNLFINLLQYAHGSNLFRYSQRIFQRYSTPLYTRLLHSEEKDVKEIGKQLENTCGVEILAMKKDKVKEIGGHPIK